jgi:hypothetical protein
MRKRSKMRSRSWPDDLLGIVLFGEPFRDAVRWKRDQSHCHHGDKQDQEEKEKRHVTMLA